MVQAGTDSQPKTLSGRLLVGAWFFFSLILVSTYTANLAAFLTVTRITSPIQSVNDLAAQSNVKYGTVLNTQVASFFRNSRLEHFQRMWTVMSTMEPSTMVNSSDQGLQKVKESDGDYAFMWDSPVVQYASSEDCDYHQVGHWFDSKGYGIGVPLGAVYRDKLTMAILKLNEEGRLSQLEKK